jgi:hypothetical protein
MFLAITFFCAGFGVSLNAAPETKALHIGEPNPGFLSIDAAR